MPIFRKEQLNKNSQKTEMLDIIIVLWIFSSALLKSVLYFFNLESNSGQLAIVYILVAITSAFLCFKYFSRMIPASYMVVVLLFFVIGTSFVFTGFRFGFSGAKYFSEFKSFFAMVICTMLITLLVTWRRKTDINLNVIFAAVLLLSLISFLSLFKGDSITTGGYIRDSSGLIYQNVSYYSAHAFGLTLFHFSESRRIKPLSWFNKIIYLILLIIQTSTCLLSGGRGGLVLLFVIFITSVIFTYGKKSYKIVIPSTIFVLIIRYTVPWLIDLLGINIKGFTRIMNFLGGDILRDARFGLYSQSLSVFYEKPLLGNGIGSVFSFFNSYSHNLFLDILVEIGLIGLLLFVVLLIVFIKKCIFLYHQGSLFRFLIYIFICGMTLNLFSGYVWSNQFVWLPIAVILTVQQSVDFHKPVDSSENITSDNDDQDDSHILETENNG